MLKPEPVGDIADSRLAHFRAELQGAAKLAQRRAAFVSPFHDRQALTGAAERQIVSDDAKCEVVREYVGSRNEDQHA
jgi:hypothetical protein